MLLNFNFLHFAFMNMYSFFYNRSTFVSNNSGVIEICTLCFGIFASAVKGTLIVVASIDSGYNRSDVGCIESFVTNIKMKVNPF
jgi:hypothetical protein